MSKVKSILHPRVGGVIYATGLHGTGKTTFATGAEDPALTGVLDLDLKFEDQARDLGYAWYEGPYSVPTEPFGYNVGALASWFSEVIKGIPSGLTTLVIDNGTGIETALGSIVKKDPARYGVNPSNAASGRYGGVNPGVGKLWQSVFSYLKSEKGIRLVVLVSHMSQPWVNGAPVPNRYRGKGNRVLQQYSNLSLVMVPGDNPPTPSAVILKEALAKRTFDRKTGKFETVRTLPFRLPEATWPAIVHYLDNPANFKNPGPGEVPSFAELATYGSFMSEEQLEFIRSVSSYEDTDEGSLPVSDGNEGPTPAPTSANDASKCPGCGAAVEPGQPGHAPKCPHRAK